MYLYNMLHYMLHNTLSGPQQHMLRNGVYNHFDVIYDVLLRFLLRSNSYFLIQLIFNLCEKCCSSNQTENLFDVLNALFDGIYLVNEIDFSIFVRKTRK